MKTQAMLKGAGVMLVAICLVLSAAANGVEAALIAEDDFESYPAGTDLHDGAGGTGWTNAWTATESVEPEGEDPGEEGVTVVSRTLADPNGQVGGGNRAVSIPSANIGSQARRDFPVTTAAAVYMGFLMRTEGTAGGFEMLQITAGGTGNTSQAMSVGIVSSGFLVRFGGGGGSAIAGSSASGAQVDTDYFFLAKFSKVQDDGDFTNPDNLYNRIDLFINPEGSEGDNTPLVTLMVDDDHSRYGDLLSELWRITHRSATPQEGKVTFLDELRVGTTFESVIPEPASLGLLAMGSVLLLRRRR